MNNNDRFHYLLQQYQLQQITPAENDEFFEILSSGRHDQLLTQSIQQDLEQGFISSSADLPPHIAEEIVRKIFAVEKSAAQVIPMDAKRHSNNKRWLAAASVILLLITSVFFFNQTKKQNAGTDKGTLAETHITEENNANNSRIVTLKDGSQITLQPNSSIRYANSFNDSLREVYLDGEAFFEVTKNPQKPFLVYHGHLITKVLGTSFAIKPNMENGSVEVAVKTGRVQVYENLAQVKGSNKIESVILTPNQKAVYQMEKRILQSTLVTTPIPIKAISENNETEEEEFVYDQQKLAVVFNDLEKMYGIEIVVESSDLNNCFFTGDVSSQDLFTKLKIICRTTNSSYEISGTRILIKGRGCQ